MDITNHSGIDFSIGPITVCTVYSIYVPPLTNHKQLTGYVDTSNYGVGVEVKLFGISLGTFYGDLKQGLGISINVIAAKGEVKLTLEDGAVWVTIQLTPVWGSGINIHQRLFDLPIKEPQAGGKRQSLKY